MPAGNPRTDPRSAAAPRLRLPHRHRCSDAALCGSAFGERRGWRRVAPTAPAMVSASAAPRRRRRRWPPARAAAAASPLEFLQAQRPAGPRAARRRCRRRRPPREVVASASRPPDAFATTSKSRPRSSTRGDSPRLGVGLIVEGAAGEVGGRARRGGAGAGRGPGAPLRGAPPHGAGQPGSTRCVSSAEASPVVPATTTDHTPRSTRRTARSAVAEYRERRGNRG